MYLEGTAYYEFFLMTSFVKPEIMQICAKPVFALQLPTSTLEIFLQMQSVFSISLFYSTNEFQENYEVSQILTEFVVTVFW